MRKPNTARVTSDAAPLLSYGIGPLVCHGFSCLAAAGGRLLRPGDAPVGSVVPAVTAALLLLYCIGWSLGPGSDRPGSAVRVITMREEQ